MSLISSQKTNLKKEKNLTLIDKLTKKQNATHAKSNYNSLIYFNI